MEENPFVRKYDRWKRKSDTMTDERKERKRLVNRIYYYKNKKKCLEITNEYNKQIRTIRKELNQCITCGEDLFNKEFVTCIKCRLKNRARSEKRHLLRQKRLRQQHMKND